MFMRNVLIAMVLAAGAAAVSAQEYPNKPIQFVIPYPPSGAADLTGRVFARRLTERLGQPVVVVNRPGANGSIAAELVAKSAPDGYTLLFSGDNTHGINGALYAKIPYDPVKDFAPVALTCSYPSYLVVNPAFPAKSVKELVAYVRAHPGEVNYGSLGNGSIAHLSAEILKTRMGLNMVHIAFRGSAEAMNEVVAGRVQVYIANVPLVLPQMRAGTVRVLAFTSSRRSKDLPEIPTMAESGIPDYDVSVSIGVLAPAGTPRDVIRRLAAETAAVAKIQDYRDQIEKMGAEVIEKSSPEDFAAYIRAALVKWAKVVKDSGAKID